MTKLQKLKAPVLVFYLNLKENYYLNLIYRPLPEFCLVLGVAFWGSAISVYIWFTAHVLYYVEVACSNTASVYYTEVY